MNNGKQANVVADICPDEGLHICLIEFRWVGHHPMYYCYILKALLNLGHRVYVICPDPATVTRWVEENIDHSLSGRVAYASLEIPTLKIRPMRWRYGINQSLALWKIRKLIHHHELKSRSAIDHAFFASIDEITLSYFKLGMLGFRWSFSFLYLHCSLHIKSNIRHANKHRKSILRALSHPSLCSLALYDPKAISYLERSGCKCKLIVFPDFTDESIDESSKLSRTVRSLALGRTVITITGHLDRRKGLINLAEAACSHELRNYFFVFAGNIIWSSYSETEQSLIRHLHERENTFTHFSWIEPGTMNQLIRDSSLIYAVYHDFQFSSNMLIKSAINSTPILVADGHLMADTVFRYRLGFSIAEQSCLTLRNFLATNKLVIDSFQFDEDLRQEYIHANSFRSMQVAMASCIAG
jgi:hypothetical protein